MSNTLNRVIEAVQKFTEEPVTAESHVVDDLGLDSLDTVELVMAIEDEFNIEISDQDASSAQVVKDIAALIEASIEG